MIRETEMNLKILFDFKCSPDQVLWLNIISFLNCEIVVLGYIYVWYVIFMIIYYEQPW